MDKIFRPVCLVVILALVLSLGVGLAPQVMAQPSDKGGPHGSGPTTSLTNGDLIIDVEADGAYNEVFLNGGALEIDGSTFVAEPEFYVNGAGLGSSNWVIVSSTADSLSTTFDLGTDFSVTMDATVTADNILIRNYTFTNVAGAPRTLVVTEHLDGDVIDSSDDYGAYDASCQVIWQFDETVPPSRLIAFTGTSSGVGLAGFEANELGDVDHTPGGLDNVVVNDLDGDGISDLPYDDAETDLQWNMDSVNAGQSATLTIRALFATGTDPAALCGPVVDFTAAPRQGLAPLTVQFTDLSIGANSWLWDFGDGAVSRVQHPSHIYNYCGTYTVSLTVEGPGGAGIEVKTDYIEVFEEPARIIVRNLLIQPANAYPGEQVTISADVVNQGGIRGSKDIELVINGQAEQSTRVGVDPGTAQHITFTTSKSVPGTYEVFIEGQASAFNVLLRPQVTSDAGTAGGLDTAAIIAIVVIGVIFIAGIIVAFIFARR
jgi:PKD repeat protein